MTRAYVAAVAHSSKSAQCSLITSTISIRSSFAFGVMSGRVGTAWPMCSRSFAVIVLFGIWRNAVYTELPAARVGGFHHWAALFGVMVGGRLGYVLFYRPEMLREPLSILRVWEGGMSSHGGMIGLFLFTLLLRAPTQTLLDESGRQSRRGGADRIILRSLRQFHQRRALRACGNGAVGDAVSERIARTGNRPKRSAPLPRVSKSILR